MDWLIDLHRQPLIFKPYFFFLRCEHCGSCVTYTLHSIKCDDKRITNFEKKNLNSEKFAERFPSTFGYLSYPLHFVNSFYSLNGTHKISLKQIVIGFFPFFFVHCIKSCCGSEATVWHIFCLLFFFFVKQ